MMVAVMVAVKVVRSKEVAISATVRVVVRVAVVKVVLTVAAVQPGGDDRGSGDCGCDDGGGNQIRRLGSLAPASAATTAAQLHSGALTSDPISEPQGTRGARVRPSVYRYTSYITILYRMTIFTVWRI